MITPEQTLRERGEDAVSGKRSTGVNVGGSSILVIFILLCLTTFATLSMVSANADLKLTEKSAAAAQDYYAADAEAEQILAAIDAYARQLWTQNPNPAAFADACQMLSSAVDGGITTLRPAGGNTMLAQYAVPINDTHQLAVELEIVPNSQGYTLTRNSWQVQSVTDWQPGSAGLDLWGGGSLPIDGLPPV